MTESERIMDVRGGLEMVIERAQRAIDTVLNINLGFPC
uniref:Uncharacterized protein n=1 Tax=Picea glauca TaxID=3330 RepID=A0A101M1Y0_PICGL|nr:hypothetical protein ABT39_MTgene3956 [Picea glauca]